VSSHFAPALLPGTVAEPNPQITMSVRGGLSMRVVARRAKQGNPQEGSEQQELVVTG
jgi:hypothetical protein